MPELPTRTIDCTSWSACDNHDGGCCALGLYGGRPSRGVCLHVCEHGPRLPAGHVPDAGRKAKPQAPTALQRADAGRRAAICGTCEHVQRADDGQPRIRLTVNGLSVYNVGCRECGCGGLSLIHGDCPQGKWPLSQARIFAEAMQRRTEREQRRPEAQARVQSRHARVATTPPPASPTGDGPLEVVYPFIHSGLAGDPELRFSLRSLAMLGVDVRVWIVGNRPAWLSDEAMYLPKPRIPREPYQRYLDSVQKVLRAIYQPGFGNRFLVMHDDFYFLAPVDLEALAHPFALRRWTPETLSKWTIRRTTEDGKPKGIGWEKMRRATLRAVMPLRGEAYDFATHAPLLYQTGRFKAVAGEYGLGSLPLSPGVLYHNVYLDHKPKLGFKAGGHVRVAKAIDLPTLRVRCERALVLNHRAGLFKGAVEQYLEDRFPEPSPWEK